MLNLKGLKTGFGQYYLVLAVLPLCVLVGALKYIFSYYSLDFLPRSSMPIITSVLAGIVFFFGFILAGIISDYKEAEKMPIEITGSLYSIWREARNLPSEPFYSDVSKNVEHNILSFIEIFKTKYLIQKNTDSVLDSIDSFSEHFIKMDGKVSPPLMARMRHEQANLFKCVMKIAAIRETSFSKTAQALVKSLGLFFTIILMLIKLEHVLQGVLLIIFYSFILLSIIILIRDMDDPFEYEEGKEVIDEVDFNILYNFSYRIKNNINK